ncbi:hypothetical protein P700755_003129 [Psychroflexus torquis ATCC 700755]|uniref:Uncharacterized protein n=1 Tax=Psychroflexus torquis (strain ATCC 700755 / CIP 106069 / ACAM 623) TaxID=313595 RepID=K4IL26_PSYTT|nr:DUF3997 domain-containing protein [Psychroflexus torquis]AFU69796.1 hypothetical protein P700755_003129 [Psychroflexus torquis ATCC 700755]
MKKWIILLVVLLLGMIALFSLQKDEQDLGDNYYYLPLYEAIDVGLPDGAIVYKSTQKYSFDEVKIKGDVVSIDCNEKFIIVIRKPKEVKYEEIYTKSSLGTDSLEYFIVVKKSDLVKGPFSKQKYLGKRKELGVSKDLKLDFEE